MLSRPKAPNFPFKAYLLNSGTGKTRKKKKKVVKGKKYQQTDLKFATELVSQSIVKQAHENKINAASLQLLRMLLSPYPRKLEMKMPINAERNLIFFHISSFPTSLYKNVQRISFKPHRNQYSPWYFCISITIFPLAPSELFP